MTERERWIVYPLLFLALGTSLRGKLGLAEDEIAAKKIVIVDADGKPTILFKDGVVTAKKVEETEPLKGKPLAAKDLVCENLTVLKSARVQGELQARKSVTDLQITGSVLATELAIFDPKNENVALAQLSKKGASGQLILSNSKGMPVAVVEAPDGQTGFVELIQRKDAQDPIIGTVINANGKGKLELTPISKQKIEKKSAATKKKANEEESDEKKETGKNETGKNESGKDDPPAKENAE